MRCTDHCPPASAGGVAVAGAGAAGAGAAGAAVWAVLGDILWAAGSVLAVLIAAGLVVLVVLLRRNPSVYVPGELPGRLELPQMASRPPAVAVPVEPAAIEAPKAAPGLLLGADYGEVRDGR